MNRERGRARTGRAEAKAFHPLVCYLFGAEAVFFWHPTRGAVASAKTRRSRPQEELRTIDSEGTLGSATADGNKGPAESQPGAQGGDAGDFSSRS